MDLKPFAIDKDLIRSVVKNIGYNQLIIKYYNNLFKEIDKPNLVNKIESIEECNKVWVIDKYDIQKVKDFKKTNLCKDKFCSNCKKVKQASRMASFIPEMEKYKENLYHLTLTQPNVPGTDVKDTIKKVFKSMAMLIRYLNGTKKIRGIDFISMFGYQGAVRSLEITYHNDSYHIHLHVALVLDKPLGEKTIENVFSLKHGVVTTKFSEKEILIQKIWYLLVNSERVTKKNIDSLERGYSCNIDKFKEDNYTELFKYLVKDSSQENSFMTYENFKVLYGALHSVRQIQGYGCLFNIEDEDLEEDVDSIYNDIIQELQKKELPNATLETPSELIHDNSYILISRKKVYQVLKKL